MNLAPILAVCLIFLAWIFPADGRAARGFSSFSDAAGEQSADPLGPATSGSQENASPPQSQTATPQSSPSNSSTASGTAKKASSSKNLSGKVRRRKKKKQSDNSDSPKPQNQPNGASLDGSCSPGAGSTTTPSNQAGTEPATSTKEAQVANPCPPGKKVVPNGGLKEPNVQLKGGTDAEQASHQRSADQLKTAIEENLKKIEGRHLNASQQEMVTQVKRFMEQSKTAIAAGDAERGHSLAMKARLLSDELVKH